MQTRVINPFDVGNKPTPVRTASILRGSVVDNRDPKNLGRIKVRVPSIHVGIDSEDLPWCMPNCFSASNGVGSFIIPEVGSTVWTAFEDGDVFKPVWLGCVYSGDIDKSGQVGNTGSKMRNRSVGKTEVPGGGFDLDKKIIYKSASGAMLYFDDSDSNDGIVLTQSGKTSVVVANGRIHMFTEGGLSIDMRDSESDIIMGYNQTSFRLSCDDNTITAKAGTIGLKMSSEGIDIDYGDNYLNLGEDKLSGNIGETKFSMGKGSFYIDTGETKIQADNKVEITTGDGSIDLGKGLATINAKTVKINADFVTIPRGGL